MLAIHRYEVAARVQGVLVPLARFPEPGAAMTLAKNLEEYVWPAVIERWEVARAIPVRFVAWDRATGRMLPPAPPTPTRPLMPVRPGR